MACASGGSGDAVVVGNTMIKAAMSILMIVSMSGLALLGIYRTLEGSLPIPFVVVLWILTILAEVNGIVVLRKAWGSGR